MRGTPRKFKTILLQGGCQRKKRNVRSIGGGDEVIGSISRYDEESRRLR